MESLVALLKGAWRALDFARRLVLNLLFLLIVVLVVAAISSGDKPLMPSGVALVVSPHGRLVEERSGDPVDRALGASFSDEEPETVVRELLEAIDHAATDDRIEALVLDLGGLWGGGLPKLQEVAGAVDRFRASGKPVVAYAGGYSQEQYLIAAHADEVLMDPQGLVLMEGYGTWQLYYKEAIDKLAITWNVFRVGEYKSYVEPFIRNDMSPEARAANVEWLGAMWQAYQADVVAARELPADAVARYVEGLVPAATRLKGDLAGVALEAGLVDRLVTREEARQRLVELVGADEDPDEFDQVALKEYLRAIRTERRLKPGPADKVAVVVAAGEIFDGEQPPGSVGGESTGRLIRQARQDDSVKAIVLRVDSPGGSQFASEEIRRELALAREQGLPVVVSMSSVAASGGYWIALAADEVWASPSTVTGSIGIFGMFPTFERTLAKVGIASDGVGTTPFSDALRLDRPMREEMRQLFQLSLEHGYAEFIGKVAEARGMELQRADELARGRVWIGARAKELGLVDQLGGLHDALASAATRAGLEPDDYRVEWVERELTFGERFLIDVFGEGEGARLARAMAPQPRWAQSALVREVGRELDRLARFNDPAGRYAYCFCEPR